MARSARGVVFLGGTFDPPHRWHMVVGTAARRRAFPRGGWIVFVPAARSPFKGTGPVAVAAERVEMVRLAAARLRRAVVWTDEIDRAGSGRLSYTVETLARARRVLPRGMPMRLVIGADQAAEFHRWREFRRVMVLAEPLVAPRPPVGTRGALRRRLERAGVWSREEIEAWMGRVVPARVRDVSSTAVRGGVRRGRMGRVRGEVASGVMKYIEDRGLYQPARRRPPT